MSIYETGRYAVRPKRRSFLPRLFIEAFALAVAIWTMSHAVGLADLYLHFTTRSILVDSIASKSGPGSHPYAVAFNETLCTTVPSNTTCLSSDGGWASGHPEILHSGYNAITNRTGSKFNIITLADALDAAIVVPGAGTDLTSTTFIAQTFSARANCRIINRECQRGEAGHIRNCAPAGYPGLPLANDTSDPITLRNYVLGVVNGTQQNPA